VSLSRYAKKRDNAEAVIVEAIRKAGWRVWLLDKPCDLVCWKDGSFRCLEVKTIRGKKGQVYADARQARQAEFLELTGVTIVKTPEEALRVLDDG